MTKDVGKNGCICVLEDIGPGGEKAFEPDPKCPIHGGKVIRGKHGGFIKSTAKPNDADRPVPGPTPDRTKGSRSDYPGREIIKAELAALKEKGD